MKKNIYINICLYLYSENWIAKDAAWRDQAESISWHLWQPLYGPCMISENSTTQPDVISYSVGVDFEEGGKLVYPEKNPWSRLQPMYEPSQDWNPVANVGGVNDDRLMPSWLSK